MTGDPHRAEDLAQETFARVFARRKHYQPVARFSTFVWRIAINLCYDELRRIGRRNERLLDDDEDETWSALEPPEASQPRPDTVVEEQERAELVRSALLQLPEQYRAVVVLRHYEGLKFHEIAGVLGIPEGTVKSRMARALSRLASQSKLARVNEQSHSCRTQDHVQTVEKPGI
jgi:RNA polymerase sigma-70 factor (ECF subfamily)